VNATGTLQFSHGADGAGSLGWLTTGAPAGFIYEAVGDDLIVRQGAVTVLTLTLDTATGAYAVTQNAPIAHIAGLDENSQAFTVAYQVTDSDGDAAFGDLSIVVNDDTPLVTENPAIQLDETALPDGIGGGTLTQSGTLSLAFGADGAGSVSWLTVGAPEGFSYESSGIDLIVRQGTNAVMTVSLDPLTGDYTALLTGTIENAPDSTLQNFILSYQVIDSDNDPVVGSLSINVTDDIPTGSFNPTVMLDDASLAGGNPGGIGDIAPDIEYASGMLDHKFGADHNGTIHWLTTGSPAGFTYEALGDDLLIKQGAVTIMTLTLVPATGAYTVVQNAASMHESGADENNQMFTVSYKVTDSDTDYDIGDLYLMLNDDTPTTSRNAVVQLDDDALAGGNAGGIGDVNPDVVNATGTLAHSFGSDGIGAIVWLTTGAPAGFTYELSGETMLVKQGATTIMTLTVDSTTGGYSVVQNAPVAHEAGLNENDQSFSITYQVTDSDNDPVNGVLLVDINDDTPYVSGNAVVQLDDDALAGGNPGGNGDTSPDSINATGTLVYGFGADGTGSVSWLTVGAPAGFNYETSDSTLLVIQGSTTVMTLTVDSATGAYSVVQNAPLMHVSGLNENSQAFTIAYQVQDSDGDTVFGDLSIVVNDDTPTVMANANIQLDDDALAGGNPGGLGDVSPDTANGSGILSHSYGADGVGSMAWLTTGAPAGLTYEASGSDLLVKQDSTTVITLTLNPATGAYFVTQNAAFVHTAGLNENNRTFTVSYQVTDADGDQVNGEVAIDINDDTPVTSSGTVVQLDDDALAGGNPGGNGDVAPDVIDASGTLQFSYGADGAGSISWLTSGAPAGFTYETADDNLLVKQGGSTVMTLTLNTSTGAYSVVQNAPIMHTAIQDENSQTFTIAYQLTDNDGDTVLGDMSIVVNDDTPTVLANANIQLDDDALSGGNAGGAGDVNPDSENTSGVLSHSFGADGAGILAWTTAGAPVGFSYEASGTDLLIRQGVQTVITLTLDTETGAYSVLQNAAISHASGMNENNQVFLVGYQVTDSDGDFVTGEISIDVNDDTPTVSGNLVVQLDDDALAGGISGGNGDISPDSVNATGTLQFSYGADGAGTISWLTIGAPSGFTYETAGSDLLVKQGITTVMTLLLNTSTGAYSVVQNAPIEHADNQDENSQAFTISYQVADSDGDTVLGDLNILVNDDTPTVLASALVQLDDDSLSGGNPGGIGDINPDTANTAGTLVYNFGADGAGSVEWLTTGAPTGFAYEASGSSLLVKQGSTTVMTLILDSATGAYVVTQNAAVTHASGFDENNLVFTVGYQVTDMDGDQAVGELAIDINDDTPTVAGNAAVQLDDDSLLGGNPGGNGDTNPDAVNSSGTLQFSYGADGVGSSIAWLTSGAPSGFIYEAAGTNLLVKQGVTTVITLTLNSSTGAYTVTQNAPIAHAAGLDENSLALTVTYQLTDADGDQVNGDLSIVINDDTPTVLTNSTVQLDDDALSGGNPGGIDDLAPDSVNTTGILSHAFGADGAGSLAWLGNGAPSGFSYETSGDTLVVKLGVVSVMTLTLNAATGAYSIVQNAPIVHAAGLAENDQQFTIGYQVTDSDGDQVTGRLSITVNDDTPVVMANEVVKLDDDALTGGNPGGVGDVTPDTAFTSGTLQFGAGADGLDSVSWLTTGASVGFTYETSGSALLVKQDSITVMTLTLDSATGAYSIVQNAPVIHAEGMDENNQTFTVAYQVTDRDGDQVTGTLNISTNDDTPTVLTNATVQLDDDSLTGGNAGGIGDVSPDSANTTGTLSHSYGADSNGSISWITTGSPVGFTYETSGSSLLVKQGATTIMTVGLDSLTGAYSVTQNAAISHVAGLDENNQAFNIGYAVTDADGDKVNGVLAVTVNDDTPVILGYSDIAYANSNNPTPGGTGTFDYSIGADYRTLFSLSDSDFTSLGLSGQVGTNAITNATVVWQSESASSAAFSLAFDYRPDPTSTATQQATGTLSFNKVNGTYTVALTNPIKGFAINTTSNALSFKGYELNSTSLDNTQPAVSVAALSNTLYAQFTGISEPGGGTGSNNLRAVGVDASVTNFVSGELFTQAATWVSTSNTANGVAGDTIQKGEVLDFDLFTANPFGFTSATPTALASGLFLKFDGIGNEDLVTVLKLVDSVTGTQTTKALIIDNADILKSGNTVTSAYGIVLDNNDGAVVFESNDYNAAGENYLIQGAQVLVSTEGITGTAINYNSASGPSGASTTTQIFSATTVDSDVIKISDIGVVTQNSSTLDTTLQLSVAVRDKDADTTSTQTLNVLIAGTSGSLAAASSAIEPVSLVTLADVLTAPSATVTADSLSATLLSTSTSTSTSSSSSTSTTTTESSSVVTLADVTSPAVAPSTTSTNPVPVASSTTTASEPLVVGSYTPLVEHLV
jgi:phage-related protein